MQKLKYVLVALLAVSALQMPAQHGADGFAPDAARMPRLLRDRAQAAEGVVLNEVLADAPGLEGNGGGEWIELRNNGEIEIDLSGWWLGDENDPVDRLVPWKPGGSVLLPAGAFALILDPDGKPADLDLPPEVLLLRPDDSSIGNGLKGSGEKILLYDRWGNLNDSAEWSHGAGDGVSWERVNGGNEDGNWKACRSPDLSTPGRINSWTPIPLDRSVRWRMPGGRAAADGTVYAITAVLKDDGGVGLTEVVLEAAACLPGTRTDNLPPERVSTVAPFDSVSVIWQWQPPEGGEWQLHVAAAGPPAPREWNDRDTISVAVSHAPLSRVVGEAQPRPLSGYEEWLELWAIPQTSRSAQVNPVSWNEWCITVRSVSSPNSAGRSLLLGEVSGKVVLVSSGESVRSTVDRENGSWPVNLIMWPGLRLADSGTIITLADPTGATVDSSVLRPVPDLPRGHSWQRWDHLLPGWYPFAWGVGTSAEDISPGWTADLDLTGSGGEKPPDGTQEGFRLEIQHLSDGRVRLKWESRAARLWFQADLYDTSGRMVSPLVSRVLVPGSSTYDWDPDSAERRVRPGIYIAAVHASDADTGRSWAVKRALGVRP